MVLVAESLRSNSLLVHLIQSVLYGSVSLGIERSSQLCYRVIFRFVFFLETRVLGLQALILLDHFKERLL